MSFAPLSITCFLPVPPVDTQLLCSSKIELIAPHTEVVLNQAAFKGCTLCAVCYSQLISVLAGYLFHSSM